MRNYVLLRQNKTWCEMELSLKMNVKLVLCFSPTLEFRLRLAQTQTPDCCCSNGICGSTKHRSSVYQACLVGQKGAVSESPS